MEVGTTLCASTPSLMFSVTSPPYGRWTLAVSAVNDDAGQSVDVQVKRGLKTLPIAPSTVLDFASLAASSADPRSAELILPPNTTVQLYGTASGAGGASVRWAYDLQEVRHKP